VHLLAVLVCIVRVFVSSVVVVVVAAWGEQTGIFLKGSFCLLLCVKDEGGN